MVQYQTFTKYKLPNDLIQLRCNILVFQSSHFKIMLAQVQKKLKMQLFYNKIVHQWCIYYTEVSHFQQSWHSKTVFECPTVFSSRTQPAFPTRCLLSETNSNGCVTLLQKSSFDFFKSKLCPDELWWQQKKEKSAQIFPVLLTCLDSHEKTTFEPQREKKQHVSFFSPKCKCSLKADVFSLLCTAPLPVIVIVIVHYETSPFSCQG